MLCVVCSFARIHTDPSSQVYGLQAIVFLLKRQWQFIVTFVRTHSLDLFANHQPAGMARHLHRACSFPSPLEPALTTFAACLPYLQLHFAGLQLLVLRRVSRVPAAAPEPPADECSRSFTWGSTRVVVGEGKSKKILQNEDEAFDESSIPMKKFAGALPQQAFARKHN